jgi:Ca2+-binding EF-hand superfamily protein
MPPIRLAPLRGADSRKMKRTIGFALSAALLAAAPAFGQTPPAPAPNPAPAPLQVPPTAPPTVTAVPLPVWFNEIDTAKKGEISRADFLKYRMKTFEQLDTNKDNKLSQEEFLKIAEPPFSTDAPNQPPLEERRQRARLEFGNLDTNRDGTVERAEAEALVHAEFNQYDTDRDNKIAEAELRLIVQRAMQREAAERQQLEARKRQGMVTLHEFIDSQLKGADQLDKNGDGRISKDEYFVIVGPADTPQTQQQGVLPFEIRKQLVLSKFNVIDTSKDGVLDRVELTAYAVKLFGEMDLNKDRFISEDEFKKAQEVETQRTRAEVQKMIPQQPPARPPGPAPAPGPRPPAQQGPAGPPPGLPQGTR